MYKRGWRQERKCAIFLHSTHANFQTPPMHANFPHAPVPTASAPHAGWMTSWLQSLLTSPSSRSQMGAPSPNSSCRWAHAQFQIQGQCTHIGLGTQERQISMRQSRIEQVLQIYIHCLICFFWCLLLCLDFFYVCQLKLSALYILYPIVPHLRFQIQIYARTRLSQEGQCV